MQLSAISNKTSPTKNVDMYIPSNRPPSCLFCLQLT